MQPSGRQGRAKKAPMSERHDPPGLGGITSLEDDLVCAEYLAWGNDVRGTPVHRHQEVEEKMLLRGKVRQLCAGCFGDQRNTL
jgi:hypothetical protein